MKKIYEDDMDGEYRICGSKQKWIHSVKWKTQMDKATW